MLIQDVNSIHLYAGCYIDPMKRSAWMLAHDTMVRVIMSSNCCHKVVINLQILQAADERREAELHQKDEEIRQKSTQLEQVQVNYLEIDHECCID